ncbi:hypothetical protein ACFXJJ_12685, partial [Streptomyces sp. NPDC059233]
MLARLPGRLRGLAQRGFDRRPFGPQVQDSLACMAGEAKFMTGPRRVTTGPAGSWVRGVWRWLLSAVFAARFVLAAVALALVLTAS